MAYNILLVDDDELFRGELRAALVDYRVWEAGNGQEALQLLRRPNEIDLVVLDVKLPGMSGTQLLGEIKRLAPHLGTVILTGHGTKDVAVEALRGHADDYLEKPVDLDKTRVVFERLLRLRQDQAPGGNVLGKIEKLKRFLQRNYDKKVSLADAAAVIYLSPKYLSRVFKQETGVGFSEYQQRLKLGRAQELLRHSAYNINQIAEELGYQNTETFLRLFKKMTGMTPGAYRAQAVRLA